ncbi:peptidyl-tRNA hydrolase, partial [Peziza echinospora]
LLVGLGNPGPEYQATRHNMGADWVAQLANRYQVPLRLSDRFHGFCGVLPQDANRPRCHLLIPATFMNQSGRAVRTMAHFYKIPTTDILIIHDELDLSVGQARFKEGGGSGGHNGLKDVIAACGRDFWRLRLGISRPQERNHVIAYVLQRPTSSEQKKLQNMFNEALEVFPSFLSGHAQEAMHQLHSISL